MNIKNNKGLSLVELIITIAIIALIMPMATQLFLYGMKDYMSGTKFIMQQSDLNSFFMNFRHDYEMGRDLYLPNPEAGFPSNYLKYIVVRYDPAGADCKLLNQADATVAASLQDDRFCRRYEFKELGTIDVPAKGAVAAYSINYGELRVALIPSFVTDEVPQDSSYTTLLRNVNLTRLPGDEFMSGIFYNSSQKRAWFKISLVNMDALDETADVNRSISKPMLLYFDYPNKNTDFS